MMKGKMQEKMMKKVKAKVRAKVMTKGVWFQTQTTMEKNVLTSQARNVPSKKVDGAASEEECSKACAEDSECVAYSAQFGKWCIGCKEELSEDHKGATAFKKSPGDGTDEGD